MFNYSEILNSSSIAVVGVSRKKLKFGYSVFKELINRNKNVFPVNSTTDSIDGFACLRDIRESRIIPELVILVIKPYAALRVIKENYERGVKYFWLQPGAESQEIIDFCKENNVNCITGKCVFMYLEPVKGIHSFHRFFAKLFKKY